MKELPLIGIFNDFVVISMALHTKSLLLNMIYSFPFHLGQFNILGVYLCIHPFLKLVSFSQEDKTSKDERRNQSKEGNACRLGHVSFGPKCFLCIGIILYCFEGCR
jgi:hypothetical protein